MTKVPFIITNNVHCLNIQSRTNYRKTAKVVCNMN